MDNGQDYLGLTTESQYGVWMPEDIQGLDVPSDRSIFTQTDTTCRFGIAIIVDVLAIPTIQRYSDDCRIKTRLSGQAPSNLQETPSPGYGSLGLTISHVHHHFTFPNQLRASFSPIRARG